MAPRPREIDYGSLDTEEYNAIDFAKLRVGLQSLDDAILDLGALKKNNRKFGDKAAVLKALAEKDYATLREMSNYYYEVSGIYERLCKYFAFLYRYDWYVVPYVEEEKTKSEKVLMEFSKVLNYLGIIKNSSNHLMRLINNVLDMTRIESGKMKIQTNITSLERVIQDVDNVVQPQIQAKKINYTIERHGDLQKLVHCDNLRLNQVLINILGNAVKYTPENGMIKFTISEMPQIAEGYVSYQFRIKDNGIGMSDEFVSKIFTPFERERNTTISGIQGTGLGMSIVKGLVEMMGGQISITSKIKEGTEEIPKTIYTELARCFFSEITEFYNNKKKV